MTTAGACQVKCEDVRLAGGGTMPMTVVEQVLGCRRKHPAEWCVQQCEAKVWELGGICCVS
jgi:hypothetical protein